MKTKPTKPTRPKPPENWGHITTLHPAEVKWGAKFEALAQHSAEHPAKPVTPKLPCRATRRINNMTTQPTPTPTDLRAAEAINSAFVEAILVACSLSDEEISRIIARELAQERQAAQKIKAALNVVLDQVDYTIGNCSASGEPVGAVLDRSVIKLAREALAQPTKSAEGGAR